MSRKHLRRKLYREANGYCSICGEHIDYFSESTIDHVIPKSKGGSNKMSNLKIAHAYCNRKKGNKLELYEVTIKINKIIKDKQIKELYPPVVVWWY